MISSTTADVSFHHHHHPEPSNITSQTFLSYPVGIPFHKNTLHMTGAKGRGKSHHIPFFSLRRGMPKNHTTQRPIKVMHIYSTNYRHTLWNCEDSFLRQHYNELLQQLIVFVRVIFINKQNLYLKINKIRLKMSKLIAFGEAHRFL